MRFDIQCEEVKIQLSGLRVLTSAFKDDSAEVGVTDDPPYLG